MKSPRQFLSLLKFEIQNVPPTNLIFPFFIILQTSFMSSSPELIFSGANTYLVVMFAFTFASVILNAGDMSLWSGQRNAIKSCGLDHREFTLTRAIDRHDYAFAKTAAFSLVFLGPFLFLIAIVALYYPGLEFHSYDTGKTPCHIFDSYLKHFPKSHLEEARGESRLILPHGRIFKALWDLWKVWFVMILTQAAVAFVMGRRFKKTAMWMVSILLLSFFVLPWMILFHFHWDGFRPPEEYAFFFFHDHIVFMLVGVVALAVVVHCFYARKVQKMEVL